MDRGKICLSSKEAFAISLLLGPGAMVYTSLSSFAVLGIRGIGPCWGSLWPPLSIMHSIKFYLTLYPHPTRQKRRWKKSECEPAGFGLGNWDLWGPFVSWRRGLSSERQWLSLQAYRGLPRLSWRANYTQFSEAGNRKQVRLGLFQIKVSADCLIDPMANLRAC